MARKLSLLILLIAIFVFYACERENGSFTFIVTADMRYTAKEEYRDSRYFLGACEAIKKYGKGAFMISPGDIDPPSAVYEVVAQVLGEDYPWYPVAGNHELDAEPSMRFLRDFNKNGNSLPNIVRIGPPGCIETTYSFDWTDHHFVVLNQYYDGISDIGTDGDHVPQLLEWLEKDLSETTKKYIFVFGHEPMIAIPDIDNGRLRHADDSLNKYPQSSLKFHQLLKKYQVTAYICGHTHNTSIAKINDVWQIDAGHARGIEAYFPDLMFGEIMQKIEQGKTTGVTRQEAIAEYYKGNDYEVKKILDYSGLTGDISYKKIDDKTGLDLLYQFVKDYAADQNIRDKYKSNFWINANLARSTFLKVITGENNVKVEIYRDDARGGEYQLRYSFTLN